MGNTVHFPSLAITMRCRQPRTLIIDHHTSHFIASYVIWRYPRWESGMLSVAECCTHNATALKRMAFACKAFREGAEQVVATLLGSINDEMSHASRREAASILSTDLG